MKTLRRFSDAFDITYPLLADVGSKVIEELGILNTTMEAERAAYGRKMEARHYRLPYPGTFSLDGDGVVVARSFEQSHRVRPTTNTLLSELTGDVDPAVSAETSVPGVRVAAWLDAATVSGNQLQYLTVALELDEDVHLYVPPVPDGYTALSIEVDADQPMKVRDHVLPEGQPFRVVGLDEDFRVIEGSETIRVPFYLETDRDTAGDEDLEVDIRVALAFQACTSEACFIPERVELRLPVLEVGNPEYEELNDKSVRPLMIRRLDEQSHTAQSLRNQVQLALREQLMQDQVDRLLEDMLGEGLVVNDGSSWSVTRPD